MESKKFFEDKEFNKRWKGKSGIYIIENPLFTKYVGYPVYKTGYARNSLYTRIADYRTAYGPVPYKIHAIYAVPEKVLGRRVNYANLTERVLQETARKYGEYADVGEWFKNIGLLLNIVFTIRKKHLKDIKNAKNWDFYTFIDERESLNKIDLVDEKSITGTFKDLVAGRTTRSGDNEDTMDSENYEEVIKNVA
jgi:hypothetical protein